MKKIYSFLALILATVMLASLVSCNKEENGEPETSVSEGEASDTQEETKKSTKKETQPPVALSDTEGLDLTLKILSQNVGAYDRPNGNGVEERAERFEALIAEYAPDIVGTQDASFEALKKFRELDDYGVVGTSNLGKRSMEGEFNAILYRKDRFVLMDDGTFWLTTSPLSKGKMDKAFSYKICTWAELFDTYTGRTVIMASANFDHGYESVRNEQASILIRQLRSSLDARYTQCQIYLCCDLNATEADGSHTFIYDRAFIDVRDLALEDLSQGKGTYHAYGHIEGGREVDFCFHKGNDTVLSYEIIDKKYTTKSNSEAGFVSDHYGILATFQMAE